MLSGSHSSAQERLAVGQAPPQPAKVLFGAGAAVKVTSVPEGIVSVQVVPQLTPAGLDVIFPVPVPSFAMLNVNESGGVRVPVEVLETSSPLQAVSNRAKPATDDINFSYFAIPEHDAMSPHTSEYLLI